HINTNWLTPFKARTCHVATKRKYVIGDLLTRQVTECFGFQPDGSYSMRHLSVGHAEPLRAELTAFVEAIRSNTRAALGGAEGVGGEGGGGRLAIAIRCREGQPAEAVRKPVRRAVG